MQRTSRRRTSATKRVALRELARLEDIPNVGPAVAADLRRLGIVQPVDLPSRDPYDMKRRREGNEKGVRMDLTNDLNTILEQMGNTADEVASTLRTKGMQGVST